MNHTQPLRPHPEAHADSREFTGCTFERVRDLLETLKAEPVPYPMLADRRTTFRLQARRAVILNAIRTEAMTISRYNALVDELGEIETQLGKE